MDAELIKSMRTASINLFLIFLFIIPIKMLNSFNIY